MFYKYILISIIMILLSSCSSRSILKNGTPLSKVSCNVQVYSSEMAAKANGPIEEMCIISGTSAGSFSHTVSTAINKHKDDACECGANNVYIQSQDPGTLGTASVSLVAFRYANRISDQNLQNSGNNLSNDEELKKSKKCAKKGGIWVRGVCEIELE